jgi:multiple sugar transport system ATP-binding protein
MISLDHVGKVYDDGTRAVTDLNITVGDGELVVLVGPSGCGKTTALRMIAGLETITEGQVRIGDQVVNTIPPRDRDIAMVFQSYALYPHMNVRDNIGFGLQLRKVPKPELRRRVDETAALLGLSELLDRKPRALSGGQRQRVAMGRAIVRDPQAFLMDEPLSNLDAKLRVQMRAEITRLQRDLRATTVYVTHDQIEAMTLGHRVAVMQLGVLQQIAPPQELYDRPANLFVAGFIGSPAMNLLSATLERESTGDYTARVGNESLTLPREVLAAHPGLAAYGDRQITIGIRPEDAEDASLSGDADGRTLSGVADIVELLGSDIMVYLSLSAQGIASGAPQPDGATAAAASAPDPAAADASDPAAPTGNRAPAAEDGGTAFVARFTPGSTVAVGDRVRTLIDVNRMHFFDPKSGAAIWGA